MTQNDKKLLVAHKTYFPFLTGYRIMAAYMVYLHHHALLPDLPIALSYFLQELHIGVSFFFVLSGFIITYTYYDQLNIFSGKAYKHYLINRIARIYPMFFLLSVATLLYKKDTNVWHWMLNMTLLKGFFDQEKFTGIGAGWSLTVEECFYILAPVIFIVHKRVALWIQVSTLLLIGFLLVTLSDYFSLVSFFANVRFMLIYTFFGRCFEFFCGFYIARHYFYSFQHSKIFYFLLNHNLKSTYTSIICILLIVIAMTVLREDNYGLFHPLGMLLNNIVLPLSISLFIVGLLKEDTSIKGLLSLKFVQLLGKSSYIFYLIHAEFFYDYLHKYFYQLLPSHYYIVYLLTFIALNIVSVILFRFIEKPLNIIIRKSVL